MKHEIARKYLGESTKTINEKKGDTIVRYLDQVHTYKSDEFKSSLVLGGEIDRVLEERNDYLKTFEQKLAKQELASIKKILEGTTLLFQDGTERVVKKVNKVTHTEGRYGSEYHIIYNGKLKMEWDWMNHANGQPSISWSHDW